MNVTQLSLRVNEHAKFIKPATRTGTVADVPARRRVEWLALTEGTRSHAIGARAKLPPRKNNRISSVQGGTLVSRSFKKWWVVVPLRKYLILVDLDYVVEHSTSVALKMDEL
jgi:hypothetical protein